MSYNVTTTAGVTIATIADGTVNTSATSLTLIGKNYAGYGLFLNENYTKLLENFANTVRPDHALAGQLWYDTTNNILNVNKDGTSTGWKPISSSAASSSSPTSPVTGDLWWDTSNAQLKVWSGSAWVTIGPSYTATSGTSGAVVETILDSSSISHVVVKFYISNSVIAILSKDSTFTPQTSIAGFTTVKPGMNLISASILTGAQFTGDASNALQVGGVTGGSYLRNDQNTSTPYQITAGGGLVVSADLTIASTTGTVSLTNSYNNGDMNFWVKKGGSSTNVVNIDGGTATVAFSNAITIGTTLSVTGAATITGNANHQSFTVVSNAILPNADNTINIGASNLKFNSIYADNFIGNVTTTAPASMPSIAKTGTNGVGDIGQTANRFGTVYATEYVGHLTGNVTGTAVTALYADLAERFETDLPLIPGTVVELGGLKEITAAVMDLSEAVFGVISTNAGFLMNGGAGNDTTHPPVAVNGRVPVRVLGLVRKGDRLVSAGRGLARAALRSEMTAFNVIGRALENKETMGEGTVEAIVKLNS